MTTSTSNQHSTFNIQHSTFKPLRQQPQPQLRKQQRRQQQQLQQLHLQQRHQGKGKETEVAGKGPNDASHIVWALGEYFFFIFVFFDAN